MAHATRQKKMTGDLPTSTDVFVVGGGPAGLAAAIAARQRGFDVVVADGIEPPIDKACGEGLMPDALDALAQLGIPLSPGEAHSFGGIHFLGSSLSAGAEFPFHGRGVALRRTVLHRVLMKHEIGRASCRERV